MLIINFVYLYSAVNVIKHVGLLNNLESGEVPGYSDTVENHCQKRLAEVVFYQIQY